MTDDQRFGLSRHVTLPGPLRLDGGVLLSPVDIAYETYGDPAQPAILICHALTGDQHVASEHPVTGKAGWWERMVGLLLRPLGNVLYFMPPYVITDDEVDWVISQIGEVLRDSIP